MTRQTSVPESPWGRIYQITETGSPASPEYTSRAERDSISNYTPEGDDIIADLRQLGWRVNSIWDVVNARARFPDDQRLYPLIESHLERTYSDRVLEGLILAGPVNWRDRGFLNL
jgi:hypothetical protein